MKMKNYLVFDAGGTFTKYALMNENAEILEKDKVPTPDYHTKTKEDYYAVLDSVVEKYKNRIEGIAISMPGMLDNRNGYCVTAGYLDILQEVLLAQNFPSVTEFRFLWNDGNVRHLPSSGEEVLRAVQMGLLLLSEPVLQAGSSSTESFSAEIILPQANTAIYAQRRRGRQSWTTTGE